MGSLKMCVEPSIPSVKNPPEGVLIYKLLDTLLIYLFASMKE